MHELSIAMSIVDIAIEYAQRDDAHEVREIEIEVGTLSGVVVDALDMAMEAAVKHTICDGAEWKITEVQARIRCPESGESHPVNSLFEPCPECGNYGHELIEGKELRVRSLLVD
jgi:hydrogenase nickel incorporation protein HypA/HybF